MRGTEMSTTQTSIAGHFSAMTAMVGPPTYPAPRQHIFTILLSDCMWNMTITEISYVSKHGSLQQEHSCYDVYYAQRLKINGSF
jgi:hypothetical protein